MLRQDELNWSTDLLRIAWWLQTGNEQLVHKFIERGKKLYAEGRRVGKREWGWWMSEIGREDKDRAAERALTWSVLLR